MSEEPLEVIDKEGNAIRVEKRSAVHKQGLLHRGIHAFVLNTKGNIFIQQRTLEKPIGPGKWDLSTAEHLKPNESYEQAAIRGIKEELGIEATGLQKIDERNVSLKEGNLKDNEHVQIFKSGFKGEIKLQGEEVIQGKWITKEQLLKEMNEEPEKFTPGSLKKRTS